MSVERIKACRVCGNTDLVSCIDIGDQYLSSIFPDNTSYREDLKRFPLEIVQCRKSSSEHCGSLQLAFDCDISDMYRHYPYTSSSNTSMKKILEDVANSGKALGFLKTGDVVLDIGCNDGTLMSFFEKEELDLIGIDPAENVESRVNSSRFTRVKGFFSEKAFTQVSSKKASLVFSVAMFYHLSDPVQFCKNITSVLKDDGVVVIQMVYLPAMIKTNMYDNIVHEHVGYYGTHQMKWILEKAGLELFDVILNDVYGGSFRLFAKKKSNKNYSPTPRLAANLKEEENWKIFDTSTYSEFMKRIEKTKVDLQKVLSKAHSEGKKVWIYG
ncbi:MAG: class I SAM-dependent methyltransferase, partial [Bdellovibrionia bacterium]